MVIKTTEGASQVQISIRSIDEPSAPSREGGDMSADGPEQREADRLERDTYDHDQEAAEADEDREVMDELGALCYWLDRVQAK